MPIQKGGINLKKINFQEIDHQNILAESNGRTQLVFKYVDEFGDVTEFSRNIASDYLGLDEQGVICEIFKDFMVACGFIWLSDKIVTFVDDK